MEGIAAVIAAVTAMIAALGALWVNVQNGRKASAAKVAAEVQAKVIADGLAAAASEAAVAAARAEDARLAAIEATKVIVRTEEGLFTVDKRIDGRLTALLEATAKLERSLGRAEGVAAEQERVKAGNASIPAQPPVDLPVIPPLSVAEGAVPIEVRVIQNPDDPAVRVKDVRQ